MAVSSLALPMSIDTPHFRRRRRHHRHHDNSPASSSIQLFGVSSTIIRLWSITKASPQNENTTIFFSFYFNLCDGSHFARSKTKSCAVLNLHYRERARAHTSRLLNSIVLRFLSFARISKAYFPSLQRSFVYFIFLLLFCSFPFFLFNVRFCFHT